MTTDVFEDATSPFEDEAPELITETGGRRRMPHPITGKPTWFTRASGWGGIMADRAVLEDWKVAMAVLGIGMREDLYGLASSHPRVTGPVEKRPKGWWMPWFKIGEKAMDAAEYRSGAHKGTTVHAFREQLERGEIEMEDIPSFWQPHLEAIMRVHAASAMELRPEYIERMVLTTQLHNGVCGKLDNLRELPDGSLVVDDTKTGKQAPEGLDEIAVQLAVYANAEWHWVGDYSDGHWVPAPANIRKDVATITWCPIDDPANTQIIPIDIEWGWKAAQVAAWVRQYRNRSRRKGDGLVLPLSVLQTSPKQATRFDFAARIAAATTRAELSNIWLDAVAAGQASPEIERLGMVKLSAIKALAKPAF